MGHSQSRETDRVSAHLARDWLDALLRPASAPVLAVMVLAGLTASFAIFGRGLTLSGIFVNDTFVFFDGIDRIAHGQVPHVDFSTPVGALAYYLPYLGFRFLGGYGGAVELASLALAAFTVSASAVLLWRRCSVLISALVLTVVAGIIIVPLVPGFRVPDVSHAMHYNRWGWGCLIALFVLACRPSGGGAPPALAGGLGAACLLILFFVKMTYFAVGSAFLALLFLHPDQRRTEGFFAMLGTAAGLLLIGAVAPDVIAGYVGDIALALQAGGGAESRRSYLDILVENRWEAMLLALAAGAGLLGRNIGWRDWILVAFIAGSGVALLRQNFQFVFFVSWVSAFAVLAGAPGQGPMRAKVAHLAIFTVALLMLAPYARDWAGVAWKFDERSITGDVATIDAPGFDAMFVTDRAYFRYNPPAESDRSAVDTRDYLRGDDPVATVTETQYIAALNDAVRLIDDQGFRGRPVLTLDFTNAVPLMVGAPRVSGGYSWLHLGRNVSAEALPAADRMFAGFDLVIVPFGSLTEAETRALRRLFGPYLADHAEILARSDHWILTGFPEALGRAGDDVPAMGAAQRSAGDGSRP